MLSDNTKWMFWNINIIMKKALDNANEIVTTARLGYRTGDTGYLEYLHALQDATAIRLNYLESIDKINKSVIHIYSIINQ
jgi:cobalt-zinc-cadmium resistance protein CzcA